MRNIHDRVLHASSEEVGAWVARLWSGSDGDCFPRDVIASWRKTDGVKDPLRLVEGRTRLGHGPFSFDFQRWDGTAWRVGVAHSGMRGWHGFDLEPAPGGTRLRHTIELELSGSARLVWPLLIEPIHNWAVEAIFDRLEDALASGAAPTITRRPMPLAPRLAFGALRLVRRRRAAAA